MFELFEWFTANSSEGIGFLDFFEILYQNIAIFVKEFLTPEVREI